jgi:hypothetical protein
VATLPALSASARTTTGGYSPAAIAFSSPADALRSDSSRRLKERRSFKIRRLVVM